MDYELQELEKEEGEALTAELKAVLEKYNAEMGVSSKIEMFKRVTKDEKSVVSPVQLTD